MSEAVQFVLNGKRHDARPLPGQSLLDHLRGDVGLMATRLGCGVGQCGACHVLIDGRSTASCATPLAALQGGTVTTLEGLGTPAAPHPLQTAFIAQQALQCGFCTSGLIVSAAALLQRCAQPSEREIRSALDGHLCRCGVQQRVVRAVQQAAQTP